jgi:hypothetical protein
MKPSLLILTAAAILLAEAAGSSAFSAGASAPVGKPRQLVLYGHVKSIARNGARFDLRFDPALWLTGTAAEQACGCKPVPNDYVTLDETHRLLRFAVRPDARVTVITRSVARTTISVQELAQIVAGKNPRHRHLLEPKAGFWIRIGAQYPNPIVSLDQQYQP